MVQRSLVTGCFLLLIPLVGCQTGPASSAASGSHRARAPLHELDLSAVAYLGLSKSAVADETALRLMEPEVEAELLSNPPAFVLLPPAEVEARVARTGCQEAYRAVLSLWRDDKKVDPLKMRDFCDAIGVNGILVGTIDEWMQSRASGSMNEPAYTKVAATLRLYLAGEGRYAWRKKESHTIEFLAFDQESVEQEAYAGGSSASGSRDLGRMRSTAGDPPRYEDVIPIVAEALAKALAEESRP